MAAVISLASVIKPFSKYLLIKEIKPRDAHLAFVQANSSMQFHVLVKVLFVLECFGTHFTLVYGHSVMSIHVPRQFRFRYTLLPYNLHQNNVPRCHNRLYTCNKIEAHVLEQKRLIF